MLRPEWTTVEQNIKAAAEWATEMDQDPKAVMFHLGTKSAHCGGNLRVSISSDGWHLRPRRYKGTGWGVVVFELRLTDEQYLAGWEKPPPFTREECDSLKELVAVTRLKVDRDWNGVSPVTGEGLHTYSIGVSGISTAATTLSKNYSKGCSNPAHESHLHGYGNVFCNDHGHEWRNDFTKAKQPNWVIVEHASPDSPEPDDNSNLDAVRRALEEIAPLLPDLDVHLQVMCAGRRGIIVEQEDGELRFDEAAGHGVQFPAETAVRLVKLATLARELGLDEA